MNLLLTIFCSTASLSHVSCSACLVVCSAFYSYFCASLCFLLAESLAEATSVFFCAASCLFMVILLDLQLWPMNLAVICCIILGASRVFSVPQLMLSGFYRVVKLICRLILTQLVAVFIGQGNVKK